MAVKANSFEDKVCKYLSVISGTKVQRPQNVSFNGLRDMYIVI